MNDYINLHRDIIDLTIEQLVTKDIGCYENISSELKKYLDMFNNNTKGGKRIRAILVLLAYEICGGKCNAEIYKAAASYEIFQTGILIHDDLIDQSELRRGKKTIHNALGNDHLAKSNAICLGDYGILLAEKVLSELDFKTEYIVKAMKCYNKTVVNTVIGELLDVNLPEKKEAVEDDIFNISYYKTSWYTIIGPMLLGAILAGCDDSVQNEIEEFGKHLGIAFQMKDDLLGVFGDEEVIGKSVTSDIEEKKLTLLYTHVINNANEEDKEIFLKYYGKKNITLDECKIVKDIMGKYLVEHKVEEIIEHEIVEARKSISMITNDEKWMNILEKLIVVLTKRDK